MEICCWPNNRRVVASFSFFSILGWSIVFTWSVSHLEQNCSQNSRAVLNLKVCCRWSLPGVWGFAAYITATNYLQAQKVVRPQVITSAIVLALHTPISLWFIYTLGELSSDQTCKRGTFLSWVCALSVNTFRILETGLLLQMNTFRTGPFLPLFAAHNMLFMIWACLDNSDGMSFACMTQMFCSCLLLDNELLLQGWLLRLCRQSHAVSHRLLRQHRPGAEWYLLALAPSCN